MAMFVRTTYRTIDLLIVALLVLLHSHHSTASTEASDGVDPVTNEEIRPQIDSILLEESSHNTGKDVSVPLDTEEAPSSHTMKGGPLGLEDTSLPHTDDILASSHTEQQETVKSGATGVPQGHGEVPTVTIIDESETLSENTGGDGGHGLLGDALLVRRDTAVDDAGLQDGMGREGEERGVSESVEEEVPGVTSEVESEGVVATDQPVNGLPQPPTGLPTLPPAVPPNEVIVTEAIPDEAILEPQPPTHPSSSPPEAIESDQPPMALDEATEAIPETDDEATPSEAPTEEEVTEEADDVPTFTEFSQRKRMEQDSNQRPPSDKVPVVAPGGKNNYASLDCGAKIVAANEGCQNPSAILSENRDVYMINPCSADIWFIVELCELVELHSLQIACFELFSSIPKSFNVFPSDEWRSLGTMHASSEREVQSFPLAADESSYAKYVRVDMVSHYGSEHFCPLSLLRVVGASMMEVYEYSESQQELHVEPSSLTVTPVYEGDEAVDNDLFGGALEENVSSGPGIIDAARATSLPLMVADVVRSLLATVNGYIGQPAEEPAPETHTQLPGEGDPDSASEYQPPGARNESEDVLPSSSHVKSQQNGGGETAPDTAMHGTEPSDRHGTETDYLHGTEAGNPLSSEVHTTASQNGLTAESPVHSKLTNDGAHTKTSSPLSNDLQHSSAETTPTCNYLLPTPEPSDLPRDVSHTHLPSVLRQRDSDPFSHDSKIVVEQTTSDQQPPISTGSPSVNVGNTVDENGSAVVGVGGTVVEGGEAVVSVCGTVVDDPQLDEGAEGTQLIQDVGHQDNTELPEVSGSVRADTDDIVGEKSAAELGGTGTRENRGRERVAGTVMADETPTTVTGRSATAEDTAVLGNDVEGGDRPSARSVEPVTDHSGPLEDKDGLGSVRDGPNGHQDGTRDVPVFTEPQLGPSYNLPSVDMLPTENSGDSGDGGDGGDRDVTVQERGQEREGRAAAREYEAGGRLGGEGGEEAGSSLPAEEVETDDRGSLPLENTDLITEESARLDSDSMQQGNLDEGGSHDAHNDSRGSHDALNRETNRSHDALNQETNGSHDALNQETSGSHDSLNSETSGSHDAPDPETSGSHDAPDPETHDAHNPESVGSHNSPDPESGGSHDSPDPESEGSHDSPDPESGGSHDSPDPESGGSHDTNGLADKVTEKGLSLSSEGLTNGNGAGVLSGQQREKSVFLRLSNRIRDLEENMSLFSSYLDQISTGMKRNKNRTEDNQRSLERRLNILNDSVQLVTNQTELALLALAELYQELQDVADTVYNISDELRLIRSEAWRHYLWVTVLLSLLSCVVLALTVWLLRNRTTSTYITRSHDSHVIKSQNHGMRSIDNCGHMTGSDGHVIATEPLNGITKSPHIAHESALLGATMSQQSLESNSESSLHTETWSRVDSRRKRKTKTL